MENIRFDIHEMAINIHMDKRFLNKTFCIKYAKYLISHKFVLNMRMIELAQEIYAHAFCFYWYDKEGKWLKSNSVAASLYAHTADGIWIEDGGDTLGRKLFYLMIWNVI